MKLAERYSAWLVRHRRSLHQGQSLVFGGALAIAICGAIWMATLASESAWQVVEATITRLEPIARILTPLAVAAGLWVAWRRSSAHLRQAEIAEEGLITERFTRAVEQLAADKLSIRIGGIYALERIARDSDRDHGSVMEVLCAALREMRTPKPGQKLGFPALDAQAIVEVLCRRVPVENVFLVLPNVDLVGVCLLGIHLRLANLGSANLQRTLLENANLIGAHLEGASLCEAELGNADLSEAQLAAACLAHANLSGVDFGNADLQGADFTGAKVGGADFGEAQGLTQDQLDSAKGDATTRVPPHLRRPPSWLS